jgi:hypothetical protein
MNEASGGLSMLHTQGQNMGFSMILMGLAVLLFGVIMLAKPGLFKAFSQANLKPHGGLAKNAEATWAKWHQRSALFCVLIGLGMMIGGGVRMVRSGDPFDAHATPVEALSAFSMKCELDQIELSNTHTGPVWVRLSHPTVFGVSQMSGVAHEPLPDGWVFSEAVSEGQTVSLRASEVVSLAFGERVVLPLFGVSSADCGGGLKSLPLSAQGRELKMENLQVAASHCNRFQVQVALYDDPEKAPAFVGWRACTLQH